MSSQNIASKFLDPYIKRIAWPMKGTINNTELLPAWMTKITIVFSQNDLNKENKKGDFRPIFCLPLM